MEDYIMQSQYSSVYGLVDPRHKDTQLVFYVGVSEDPHSRYGEHLIIRGKVKNASKAARILEMRKEGVVPELVIFEKDLPTDDALKRETYWIEHFLALGMPLTNKKKIRQSMPEPQVQTICMLRLKIKKLAEAQDMNRSQLQIKSGVTLPLLNRYWNNNTTEVKLDALEKIARALGVKAGELFEEGETKTV
jgi:DNA-binding Xre family transcriptional regulator/predicted GIY-YIG superfamily endonuclease